MRTKHCGSLRTAVLAAVAILGCVTLAAAASGPAIPGSSRPVRAAVRFNAGLSTGSAPSLHVAGNMLVNSQGQQVVLHGVNRSGPEYMCVQGNGIFDGPSDQASITAMKQWHINAVRVLLNEACWNGDSYVNPAMAGLNYQRAIEQYVHLLNSNGLVVILDLHWSDGYYGGPLPNCASARAVCQKPMPDLSAVPFWASVAAAFAGDNAVLFDLFNEPFPGGGNTTDTAATWKCWLLGGTYCTGLGYTAAGMQQLVTAVRSAGATNVIMAGGLAWANDLSQWLTYEPRDPLNDLAASWHSYAFNECNSASCWNRQVLPVAAHVPVIAGEIGETDCSSSYVQQAASWMDAHSISYLAFTWDAWPGSCPGNLALINSYSGNPTSYGSGYQSHLGQLAARASHR